MAHSSTFPNRNALPIIPAQPLSMSRHLNLAYELAVQRRHDWLRQGQLTPKEARELTAGLLS